eukprot:TRINITY_DN5991_c0_g1_i5.p1 TRINITY_DN5991_c0_g1~~TRINITY_DN5991_c0_g1_i5.p1  ORF type:complete len:146 (-),score=32.01 TRINITY_DN5991_c0_g1_i5:816-1193(-)
MSRALSFVLFALLLVAPLVLCQQLHTGYVWVSKNGDVAFDNGDFKFNVTHIAVGHYCLGTSPSSGTYNAISVTLQSGGTTPPAMGFAVANSGWGDVCNKFGANSVYTFDEKWAAADRDFSAIIMQ